MSTSGDRENAIFVLPCGIVRIPLKIESSLTTGRIMQHAINPITHEAPAFSADDQRAIEELATLPPQCKENAIATFMAGDRPLLDVVRSARLKAVS